MSNKVECKSSLLKPISKGKFSVWAASLARKSHRWLLLSILCPLIHLNSTSCCSINSSKVFHKSAFGTFLFLLFTHLMLRHLYIHLLFIESIRYLESLKTITDDFCFNAFNPSIQAINS